MQLIQALLLVIAGIFAILLLSFLSFETESKSTYTAPKIPLAPVEIASILPEIEEELPVPLNEPAARDAEPASVPSTLIAKLMPTAPIQTKSEVADIPPSPAFSFSEINIATRSALVNILCSTSAASPINGESGSGVFVNNQGVILTNAHIAQYYLLKNYPSEGGVECTIRTGSPAAPRYRAALLYLSPDWIEANANTLTKENPMGTGEHDFALLLVTGRTNEEETLPSSFPFLPLAEAESEPEINTETLIAAYPAEFLGSQHIEQSLFAASTIAAIKEIFTFDAVSQLSKDLVSFSGNALTMKGSSGGPVVVQDGTIAGMLVTSTAGATTGERSAYAITAGHIHRSFKTDTGSSLFELLASKDLLVSAKSFENSVAPRLSDILIANLPK